MRFNKNQSDKKEKEIGIKRGSRQIYNMNIGTIPQEINYTVVLEGRGAQLGNLSEKFVENLSKNDIFVLGGRTYQFIESNRSTVVVKDGLGRKPTVPSRSGEMLPRSFDLSESVRWNIERLSIVAKNLLHYALR